MTDLSGPTFVYGS